MRQEIFLFPQGDRGDRSLRVRRMHDSVNLGLMSTEFERKGSLIAFEALVRMRVRREVLVVLILLGRKLRRNKVDLLYLLQIDASLLQNSYMSATYQDMHCLSVSPLSSKKLMIA